MTTFLTDNFAGTDATLLSAHTSDSGASWATITGWNGQTAPVTAQIIANALRATTAGSASTSGAFYKSSATPGSADYSCQADFTQQGTAATDYAGISIRMPAGTLMAGYALLFNATVVSFFKLLSSPAPLASDISVALAAGQTYRLKVSAVGTTISASVMRLSDSFYLNSSGVFASPVVNCFSVTDSAYTTAGLVALVGRGDATNGSLIDNLVAIDSTSGSATLSGNAAAHAAATGTASVSIPLSGSALATAASRGVLSDGNNFVALGQSSRIGISTVEVRNRRIGSGCVISRRARYA
jgi:hypothetical protein